ncbi:branched-chain amino acid transporter membrane protein [Polynucleobacter sp. SHI8]|uniref:branched-chain amino acid ABC transporter permease n=1 Tax=unclassified Polynucleobacter TaxID=2640945 RepID=UPI002492DA1D|nr:MULTISPECIES: branched-chain amino acid ABC transporter permease [unclassified Polynucleobacter]BDW11269.1 branched-chain amino acid transporter membrane protein [Polynucleobacter sp. SHI2]BDW13715.1 branched-chain amino acid transporter membrane protein [Polynucleobacter sp. SHI8]
MKNNSKFLFGMLVFAAVLGSLPFLIKSEYFFFAAYSVLQFVILATAWNILGGYAGYVNFGSAAFFAIGAYATVAGFKLQLPQGVNILLGTFIAGLVGLGMGYLTLRLKGVFFSIATLALSVVLLTIVINTPFLGGARGVYVIVPRESPIGVGQYIHWLYFLILGMAILSVIVARYIQHSSLGQGLMAIRDDELAAEGLGVPTLRLKLYATTISGAMMGLAGTTFPYLITYMEPTAAFNLSFAVNSIAMPIVGGLGSWLGPLIGALLLGSIQQVASVTLSSTWNLLIVGGMLVFFVTLAPNGIMGIFKKKN